MHPGHGHSEPSTLLHYFTEPVHVGIALVLSVVGALAALAVWRRRRAKT